MDALLGHIQLLLLRDLQTMKREIEFFSNDNSVWVVPTGITNPAGTLALHACGNLRHYVGHVLGGTSYIRDRAAEFSSRSVSRELILLEIDRTSGDLQDCFDRMDAQILGFLYPEQVGGVEMTTQVFLLHLCTHLAHHVGQVGYLRRILTGENKSAAPVSIKALAGK